ncbi:MAG TPA: protein translocase subunit SecF [Candidatus Babeliales bacterium]|nr:protein translocase subunit SecF [Candidatus Babeliales bacterium]
MIDFLKYRKFVALYSLLLVVGGIAVYFYKEQTYGEAFSYSIDFNGGTQIWLRFDGPVDSQKVRTVLEDNGWKNPVLREFPAKQELLVRVQEFVSDSKGLADKITQKINESISDNRAQVLQSEGVGPSIGAELRQQSIYAVLFSLIALLLYIAFVFWSFAFAFGAVVALVHDALIMVGFFLLFDREISINVIAAILTVLGYSINDTIIIFSYIRNQLKKNTTGSLYDVVNVSINKTLRRTILTSFATTLVVVSMLVFGGEVLRDLSLTLLIGIVFGTYSSIFIASPVMMLFYNRKEAKA